MDSKFEAIYALQEKFENLLISKTGNWPDKTLADFDRKDKTKFSKELAFLLFLEIAEFMGAVGNFKSHKKQEDGKDEKEIKDEIVDMFIFVLNTALTHNMTAAELNELNDSIAFKNALLRLQLNADYKRVFVTGINKRKDDLISGLINPETRLAFQEELLAISYLETFLSTIIATGDSAQDLLAEQQ